MGLKFAPSMYIHQMKSCYHIVLSLTVNDRKTTPHNIQLLGQHHAVRQLATKPFHLHRKMGKPIYEKTLGNEYFFLEHKTLIYRNTS